MGSILGIHKILRRTILFSVCFFISLMTFISSSNADVSCVAKVAIDSQWPGGLVANVSVSTPVSITAWAVGIVIPQPSQIVNSWNALPSSSSGQVVFMNQSYNGNINAGASTTFGFQLSGNATPSQIQSMVTCVGKTSGQPPSTPTPAPTATPATPTPTPVPSPKPTATPTPVPTATPIPQPSPTPGNPTGGALAVQLGSSGNPGHLVNASGQIVRLHGVDKMGSEYACVQGWGIFDGPTDQNSVNLMKSWNVNAVRIPLNEDCWLGINGVNPAYSGSNYQTAILNYVNLLTSNNIYVVLDLHWAAPGTQLATSQLPMADADHSPIFWSQVALAYKNYGNVIFDLFNEPFITDWSCWAKGGNCASDNNGQTYTTAGMGSLLKAVRSTGAQNVVIIGGLAYANDFSQWTSSVAGIASSGQSISNVAASWHQYDFNSNTSNCPGMYNGYNTTLTCNSSSQTAASSKIANVLSAGFPVIIGEVGISAYSQATASNFSTAQLQDIQMWLNNLLSYADTQQQSYFGWTWNTAGSPYLLQDYNGSPTPYFGTTFKSHLLNLKN